MNSNIVETYNLDTYVSNTKLNSVKWGKALDSGFVLIPTTLIRYQHELGLGNGELVVLLNLLMSWWGIDDLPHIQTSTIAARMNVSRRTVQRHIDTLEKRGFIKRIWGSKRGINERAGATYDLKGTVKILSDHNNFTRAVPTENNYNSVDIKELL
jgi:DNA-binding transcriptional ArsR family regulator